MRKLALVLGAVLALSTLSCSSDDAESPDCTDLSGRGTSFTITLRDNLFVPSCFTASAAQRLNLVNEDGVLHSFTLEGTPIDVDVSPNETLDLDPVAGVIEPGTYHLVCKYHAPGMAGDLTVVA
jgi:plastocyanin